MVRTTFTNFQICFSKRSDTPLYGQGKLNAYWNTCTQINGDFRTRCEFNVLQCVGICVFTLIGQMILYVCLCLCCMRESERKSLQNNWEQRHEQTKERKKEKKNERKNQIKTTTVCLHSENAVYVSCGDVIIILMMIWSTNRHWPCVGRAFVVCRL